MNVIMEKMYHGDRPDDRIVVVAVKQIYASHSLPTAELRGGKALLSDAYRAEQALHELSHSWLLASLMPNPPDESRPPVHNEIGRIIGNFSPMTADAHEIEAVAVELLVAKALGVEVSVRDILNQSNLQILGPFAPELLQEALYAFWIRSSATKLATALNELIYLQEKRNQ
jgi:hypothetical protein